MIHFASDQNMKIFSVRYHVPSVIPKPLLCTINMEFFPVFIFFFIGFINDHNWYN